MHANSCLLETVYGLVAWCSSSNAFHLSNEVTLCWTGLVLGWLTACVHAVQVLHLDM